MQRNITLRSASGIDRGKGAVVRSGRGWHERAAVGRIAMPLNIRYICQKLIFEHSGDVVHPRTGKGSTCLALQMSRGNGMFSAAMSVPGRRYSIRYKWSRSRRYDSPNTTA